MPGGLEPETQARIRQLVVEEFKNAMDTAIKPMIQQQFQTVITSVKQSLQKVNVEFGARLVEEEKKNKALLD